MSLRESFTYQRSIIGREFFFFILWKYSLLQFFHLNDGNINAKVFFQMVLFVLFTCGSCIFLFWVFYIALNCHSSRWETWICIVISWMYHPLSLNKPFLIMKFFKKSLSKLANIWMMYLITFTTFHTPSPLFPLSSVKRKWCFFFCLLQGHVCSL